MNTTTKLAAISAAILTFGGAAGVARASGRDCAPRRSCEPRVEVRVQFGHGRPDVRITTSDRCERPVRVERRGHWRGHWRGHHRGHWHGHRGGHGRGIHREARSGSNRDGSRGEQRGGDRGGGRR